MESQQDDEETSEASYITATQPSPTLAPTVVHDVQMTNSWRGVRIHSMNPHWAGHTPHAQLAVLTWTQQQSRTGRREGRTLALRSWDEGMTRIFWAQRMTFITDTGPAQHVAGCRVKRGDKRWSWRVASCCHLIPSQEKNRQLTDAAALVKTQSIASICFLGSDNSCFLLLSKIWAMRGGKNHVYWLRFVWNIKMSI